MPTDKNSDLVAKQTFVSSSQYRNFYADTFTVRINDEGSAITFGLRDINEKNQWEITREAKVLMSLSSMKLLAMTLKTAIEHHEETHGLIAIKPDVLERFDKAVTEKSKG